MNKNKEDIIELCRGLTAVLLSFLLLIPAFIYFDFMGKYGFPIFLIGCPIISYKIVYFLWKPKPKKNNDGDIKN